MNMFLNDEMYEFDLALSYASEDEFTVHKLRDYLRKKSNLKIYDYQENKKLSLFEYTPEVMKKIYSNKKVIMIMFLSENYIEKEFTNFESQFACQHLMRDKRLIVIKLDRVTNNWLPDMKDYLSLYDNEKYNEAEIYKIGDIILEALNLYEMESIEKFYSLLERKASCKLPLHDVRIIDGKIYVSSNSRKLVVHREEDGIMLSEMFSPTEFNPMPFVKIMLKDNYYLMICTIPKLTDYLQDKLSREATFEKLYEVINKVLK